MTKTPDGKWVLFDVATGKQLESWPVDAHILLDNGTHTLEPPEGVDPVVPQAPPRHVGAPRSKAVKTAEKGEPDNG